MYEWIVENWRPIAGIVMLLLIIYGFFDIASDVKEFDGGE